MDWNKWAKLLGILVVIIFSCSACVNKHDLTHAQKEREKELINLYDDTYRFQADLTHNGNPETIIMSVYGMLKDSKEPAVKK